MLIGIITGVVIITIVIASYFESNENCKGKNNILIEVTLPYPELKNKEVLNLVDSFKKANIKLAIASIVLYIPVIFVRNISIQFAFLFLVIVASIYISNKIFKKYNRMLRELKIKNDWLSENTNADEYWKDGVYKNPNDSRTIVEKRTGYGTTCNLATKKGKFMTYGGYAFGLVVGIGVLGLLFTLETAKFTMNIDNGIVNINAPLYSTSFEVSKIESVELIDEMPGGMRTNGSATDKYALGNFSINNYGKSQLYVYKDTKKYVVIKLKDSYVFINSKSIEETENYYKKLTETINR